VGDWQPLPNGSFTERPWRDIPVGATVNQEPLHWALDCYEIGSDLDAPKAGPGDTHDLALTIPECVHKLEYQLPENERRFLPDGTPNPNRLIYDLEADTVYKAFSSVNPFGLVLSGEMDLTPRRVVELRIPVRVHAHGNGDTGAAYWRFLAACGGTDWFTFKRDFADRTWHVATFDVMVPDDGTLFYLVQMESHTIGGIDFFLSGLQWRYADSAPTPDPDPVDYVVVVNLLPQNATKAEKAHVLDAVHESRQSILQSADDAARLVAPGQPGSKVRAWAPERWGDDPSIFDWLKARGVKLTEALSFPGEPPVVPPVVPPAWEPERYIAKGTVMGWHAIGNGGLPELHKDVEAPTIKLLQAVGDIGKMPATYRVVRLMDHPKHGNLEGFDYNGNPEAQAEARIAILAQLLEPLRGQFDWAEYINEQDLPGLEYGAAIGRFVKRACEVAPDWLGLAHFSFGTGNPKNLEWWAPVVKTGCLEAIASRGDAIALHSYHDHRVEGDLVHHLLRHRYLYNNYVLPRQLDIPMILTECGPWQHLLQDPTFDLMEWVRVTDDRLRADPYAMAQMYTVSDVPAWQDYSKAFKALYPQFIAWATSIKDRDNGPGAPVIPLPPKPDPPQPPPSTSAPLLGFNDPGVGGAIHWMRGEQLTGLAVIPLFIGGNAALLNFSEDEAAGIRVIVNLRYSWSTDLGGAGTLPLFGSPDWVQFVSAAGATIRNARGVWGWEIGNEVNNPREFPHAGPLTPKQVADTYNAIRHLCPGVRMSPGSLDPFNAQAGDPRDWLRFIYNRIGGAEFVAVHGYTHGVENVGNNQRFTDDPLTWQGYHYPLCITALLEYMPTAYRGLPVYVTESNHIHKDDGSPGWVTDARAGHWVYDAYEAAEYEGFAGLALYRWDGDAWTVKHNPYILATVRELAR
jgi:hypothetical protein